MPDLNSLILDVGAASLKPVLTTLLLPPVPFLGLVLAGAWILHRRRRGGAWLVALGAAGIWLATCAAVGDWLDEQLPGRPPALTEERIAQWQAQVAGGGAGKVAIVVLGGGMEPYAPEYAGANLNPWSLERLRYGLWLSRRTGAPVAFSGGVGWAQSAGGPSEARTAAGIAEREFGWPLRWIEEAARDTRENAQRTLPVLEAAGVRQVLLVTHGWHMPRAQRAFEQAAENRVAITPAPVGLATGVLRPVMRWLPTGEGMIHSRQVLREWLGLWLGA
jgi:uncharacterized SAM-binding protein YcdF (DUF218 family)